MLHAFSNIFNYQKETEKDIAIRTEGFANNSSDYSFVRSPKTPHKKSSIDKNPLFLNMKQEIQRSQINIEKLKNSKKPSKYDKEFIKTLTNLFNKNTFMLQQIVKMGELNEMNENDLKKATDTIRELNNLCSHIYGFGD